MTKDGHAMPDGTTTPPVSTDDNSPSDDWASRYVGLQKVLAKRDTDLNTRQAELDALRAEHEAAMAELREHRQKAVDASEEAQALAQYETLRERFEPAPPTPIGNNPKGEWFTERSTW